MSSVVECCVNNLSEDGLESLDGSEHDVRFSFCLDRCGQCHETDLLVVDGTPVCGDSYDEILTVVDESAEGEQ